MSMSTTKPAVTRRTALGTLGAGVLGLALAPRGRTALAQDASPMATPEPDFVALFDGTAASFADWHPTGPGRFELIDGAIVTGSNSGNFAELALLYYTPRTFGDFVLRLKFRIADPGDNSGVFVRFRDPGTPIPDAELEGPDAATLYPSRADYAANILFMAADTGFEAQINGSAELTSDPSRDDTGALWGVPIGIGPGKQDYQPAPPLQLGEWSEMENEVVGDIYTIRLNGQQTTTFANPESRRGQSPSEDPLSGYIGLQSIPFTTGHTDFRHIRIRELPEAGGAATPTASGGAQSC